MGTCSSFPTKTKVADTAINISKWKVKPSIEEARRKYQKDGTVSVACSDDFLELRVLLGEPVLLKPFLQYARDLNQLNLLLCWSSVLEYRKIRVKNPCLQNQLATEILTKYGSCFSHEMWRTLHLYLSSIDTNTVPPSTLFDDLLHHTFDAIFRILFVKYKTSSAYLASLQEMKASYNNVQADDFIYLEELGRGGFGCVVHCQKR
jgi:hypothetical protein